MRAPVSARGPAFARKPVVPFGSVYGVAAWGPFTRQLYVPLGRPPTGTVKKPLASVDCCGKFTSTVPDLRVSVMGKLWLPLGWAGRPCQTTWPTRTGVAAGGVLVAVLVGVAVFVEVFVGVLVGVLVGVSVAVAVAVRV